MGLGIGDWGLGIGDWRLGIGSKWIRQTQNQKLENQNIEKTSHGCPTPPYPLFDTPPPAKPPRKISVQVTVGLSSQDELWGKVWLIFVKQD